MVLKVCRWLVPNDGGCLSLDVQHSARDVSRNDIIRAIRFLEVVRDDWADETGLLAARPAAPDLTHWHLCDLHQPDRWESDGTCPICEGHTLKQQHDDLVAHAALLAARQAAPDLVEELADAKEAFRLSTENLAVECDKYDALVALVREWQDAMVEYRDADPHHPKVGRAWAAQTKLLGWEAPDGR